MNKFKKVALVSTLLVSTFAATAGGFGPMKIYKKLGLTEMQEQQIKQIFEGNKEHRKAHFEERKIYMEKMQKLIQAENLDAKAVEKLAEEKASKVKAKTIESINKRHQAWELLTSEQREKAQKLFKKYKKRMEKNWKKGTHNGEH